jgi:hypothetical protein
MATNQQDHPFTRNTIQTADHEAIVEAEKTGQPLSEPIAGDTPSPTLVATSAGLTVDIVHRLKLTGFARVEDDVTLL